MMYHDDTYCNVHGMEDVKYTFCPSCIDGLNHDRLSGFVESNDLPICVSDYVICGVLLFVPLKIIHDFNWVLQEYVNLPDSHIDYQLELTKHKEYVPPVAT
jgi:hypothetical protein